MIKIAFFGTPEFAGKILSGILEYSELDIALVVSQPDKQVGRKRELQNTPVKRVAIEANIEVMQPEKLSSNTQDKLSLNSLPLQGKETAGGFKQYLKGLELDFIVVVAYGKIIPQSILDIPKYGCVNIHGSLLPKYRGASPVQAAVKSGEIETGLTTMYMSKGMDEGNMLLKAKVNIDIVDTSEDIFKKFVQMGPDLLLRTLREIIGGDLKGTPQNESQVSYCGKISREDGEVFFQKQNCKEIHDTYRAYTPWPGIFTYYGGKRFVVTSSQFFSLGGGELGGGSLGIQDSIPGTFIKLSKNRYGIICSDKNILEILSVKLEGKKSMDIVSFVNGNKKILNYRFM